MDLITINYNNEQPTVSARDLHRHLIMINNFKDFFIFVCQLKVAFNREELKMLLDELSFPLYYLKFGSSTITYLRDCIQTEMVIPNKIKNNIALTESQMREEIVDNFETIFPYFTFIRTEKKVQGIGRIDIFAQCEDRPVIIELKTKRKSPNSQLLAYATKFEDPILIGITEQPIQEQNKHSDIVYLIFDNLKKGESEWII